MIFAQISFLLDEAIGRDKSETLKAPNKQIMYACDVCDYETTMKASMKEHKGSCRNETSMLHLACKKCSYRAIHSRDLRRHETQMHDQNLSYEIYGCQTCQFSTQHKEILDNHIQLEHNQKSRYFYRQKVSKLDDKENCHPQVSVPERSYSCNSCDFSTKSPGNLREHKSIHTRQAAQKPKFSGPPSDRKSSNFECSECKANFVYEDEHKLHREYFHAFKNASNQQ